MNTFNPFKKHDEDKARQESMISRQLFGKHDHMFSDKDPLVRENCAACVLGGYGVNPGESPNYAGYARIFIQAHIPIPASWLSQELARTDNMPYLEALITDINTFGVKLR